ncbi:MAG TPA: hypothetical protein VF137_09455 [Candidatus Dormibacteraeota bacterium]
MPDERKPETELERELRRLSLLGRGLRGLDDDEFPRRTATLPAVVALVLLLFALLSIRRSLLTAAVFLVLAGAAGAAAMYMNRKDARRARMEDEERGHGSG